MLYQRLQKEKGEEVECEKVLLVYKRIDMVPISEKTTSVLYWKRPSEGHPLTPGGEHGTSSPMFTTITIYVAFSTKYYPNNNTREDTIGNSHATQSVYHRKGVTISGVITYDNLRKVSWCLNLRTSDILSWYLEFLLKTGISLLLYQNLPHITLWCISISYFATKDNK